MEKRLKTSYQNQQNTNLSKIQSSLNKEARYKKKVFDHYQVQLKHDKNIKAQTYRQELDQQIRFKKLRYGQQIKLSKQQQNKEQSLIQLSKNNSQSRIQVKQKDTVKQIRELLQKQRANMLHQLQQIRNGLNKTKSKISKNWFKSSQENIQKTNELKGMRRFIKPQTPPKEYSLKIYSPEQQKNQFQQKKLKQTIQQASQEVKKPPIHLKRIMYPQLYKYKSKQIDLDSQSSYHHKSTDKPIKNIYEPRKRINTNVQDKYIPKSIYSLFDSKQRVIALLKKNKPVQNKNEIGNRLAKIARRGDKFFDMIQKNRLKIH